MNRKTLLVAIVLAFVFITIAAFPQWIDAARGIVTPSAQPASPGNGEARPQAAPKAVSLFLPLILRNYPLPSAPTLYPIQNPANDDYVVSWSSVNGAASYTLDEDDNTGFCSPRTRFTSQTLSTITFQPAGVWFYHVKASGAWGDTLWSNIQSVTVNPGLATPILRSIDNPGGVGNYMVTWSSVSGATSYTLQEGRDSSFCTNRIDRDSLGNPWFAFTGQDVGVYYYRVRAHNGNTSNWSNVQSVTVTFASPQRKK
jgi:hypothetical protein